MDFFPQLAESCLVKVVGGIARGFLQALPQRAYLGERVRQQARDLRLQRARIDDLAEGSVGGQRQQIARYVEGAGAQGALVRLLLHVDGTRRAFLQVAEHARRDSLILGEKVLNRVAEERARDAAAAEIGHVVVRMGKILIAR